MPPTSSLLCAGRGGCPAAAAEQECAPPQIQKASPQSQVLQQPCGPHYSLGPRQQGGAAHRPMSPYTSTAIMSHPPMEAVFAVPAFKPASWYLQWEGIPSLYTFKFLQMVHQRVWGLPSWNRDRELGSAGQRRECRPADSARGGHGILLPGERLGTPEADCGLPVKSQCGTVAAAQKGRGLCLCQPEGPATAAVGPSPARVHVSRLFRQAPLLSFIFLQSIVNTVMLGIWG